jgi:hypothetical protein
MLLSSEDYCTHACKAVILVHGRTASIDSDKRLVPLHRRMARRTAGENNGGSWAMPRAGECASVADAIAEPPWLEQHRIDGQRAFDDDDDRNCLTFLIMTR